MFHDGNSLNQEIYVRLIRLHCPPCFAFAAVRCVVPPRFQPISSSPTTIRQRLRDYGARETNDLMSCVRRCRVHYVNIHNVLVRLCNLDARRAHKVPQNNPKGQTTVSYCSTDRCGGTCGRRGRACKRACMDGLTVRTYPPGPSIRLLNRELRRLY